MKWNDNNIKMNNKMKEIMINVNENNEIIMIMNKWINDINENNE